jgi:secondary thiamine-phosphate synthase enzyme
MTKLTSLPKVNAKSVSNRTPHLVMLSEMVLDVETTEPIQFIDLTDQINGHLTEHEIVDGNVVIFSRHTTAAIRVNEAEELLLEDFKHMLRNLCPPERDYNHNDMNRRKPPIAPDERPNAHSHCMHLLLSTSETVPVADGRLSLGTWQRVFMVELDGPRRRQVALRFVSYLKPPAATPRAGTKLWAAAQASNGNGKRAVLKG